MKRTFSCFKIDVSKTSKKTSQILRLFSDTVHFGPKSSGEMVLNSLDERSILEADFDLFLDSGRISGSVTLNYLNVYHSQSDVDY